MMNGQTGKVVGSLPYDAFKSFLYPALLSLVLLPVAYIVLNMLV